METERAAFRPNGLQRRMFERKDEPLLLVRAKRESGKTTGVAHLAVQYGLLKPGQKILVVLPTHVMARNFSQTFGVILRQMPHIPSEFNRATLGYEFGEGSRIFVTDGGSIARSWALGHGADHLLVDEAAHVSLGAYQVLFSVMHGDWHEGKPSIALVGTPSSEGVIFDRYCRANPDCVLRG